MIRRDTAEEILWRGHCMAVRFGAPIEVQTVLLGAHQLAIQTGEVMRTPGASDVEIIQVAPELALNDE